MNNIISSDTNCCCRCHINKENSDDGRGGGESPISIAVQPPSPPPLPPPPPAPPLPVGPFENAANNNRRPAATSFSEMISNAAASSSSNISTSQLLKSTNNNSSNFRRSPLPPPPPPPKIIPAIITDQNRNNNHHNQYRSNNNSNSNAFTENAIDDDDDNVKLLLPQQYLPRPKTKLKTFPWSKLSASKIVENVMGKNNNKNKDTNNNNRAAAAEKSNENIWIKAAKRFVVDNRVSLIEAINFDDLESLFAAPQSNPNSASSPYGTMERNKKNNCENGDMNPNEHNSTSNGVGETIHSADYSTGSLNRRRELLSDINLLDRKRSLNVNIFLKQFRGGIDDLIELIASGCSHYLGLEKLRGLMKILPEPGELDILKSYTGDKCRLGNAERFFISLTNITNYRLRVESMLLKEEFLSMVDYIKPSVNTLIAAARDLKNSQSLQEVLYLLLLVGNYLNAGGYGGNAAGFKMASLWKLVEIRANKPNVTLLHYVVAEVEKRNPKLLDLPKELKHLDDASKLSFDAILSDFRHLKEKTDRVSKQVAQTDVDDEIRNQTEVFLEHAKIELVAIERDIAQVERLRVELAAFFCEDANTFKLEECLKIFATFCQRFARAIDENAERRLQEEKAEMRRRLKEQQQQKLQQHQQLHQSTKLLKSSPKGDCGGIGVAESAESRRQRLSEKYKSLLEPSNDVLLPYHYHVVDSHGTPAATRGTDKEAGDKHTSLINVLTANPSSTYGSRRSLAAAEEPPNTDESSAGASSENGGNEFNFGPSLWRRSANNYNNVSNTTSNTNNYSTKRRSLVNVGVSSGGNGGTNRERPTAEVFDSSSSTTSGGSPAASAAAVECSPIFAKTFFPRRGDVTNTTTPSSLTSSASTNDLDQRQSAGATPTTLPPVDLDNE